MSEHRLPKSVVPRKYKLHYERIDLQRFYFEGNVVISLDVVSATNSITCHAHDLHLNDDVKVLQEGKSQDCTSIAYLLSEQRVEMKFGSPLAVGKATLTISFRGVLNDKLCGFYRSKYTLDGKERFMAVTQFEATDARRALPCWDEPSLKASFECSLYAPIDRVAISNTTVIETKTRVNSLGESERLYKFDETPIMSTYLLAFVVGEFDTVTGYTKEGVQMTVYTPVGKSEQGKFALDVGLKSLSYFSDFMGIPYPLTKCDMLAIPDFSAGAMENWGCVTFREAALLLDEKNSSAAMKVRVATVVAHELAHQWFGNLVTMEWWTGLWLNEGFATYMQYVAINHIFPEWNMWTEFVATMYQVALNLDALSSSHPIEVEVNHPDEVNEIFDAISYNKGASVIRMLSDHIGLDVFMKGVQLYLKKHSYGNAVTEDLWNAIGEAAKQDINAMMFPWIKQMGYPVLILEEGGKVTQSRFLTSGVIPLSESDTKWNIPMTLISASNIKGGLAEKKRLGTFSTVSSVVKESNSTGVKLNATTSSFFRVQYTAKQYTDLSSNIANFHETDRIGLLSDAFALASAGSLSTTQALSILPGYQSDDSYPVWSEISSNLSSLASLYRDEDFFPKFKNFVVKLTKNAFETIGWKVSKSDSHNTMMFRSTVIRLMTIVGGSYEDEAIALFNSFMKDPKAEPSPLHPDLRQTCYIVAIGNKDLVEGAKAYEAVYNLYKTTDLSEEKRRCLFALGASKDVATIKKTLNMVLNGEVRSQDCYAVVMSVAANHLARDIVWQWFQDNVEILRAMFTQGGMSTVGYIVSSIATNFSSNVKADEIENFFKEHPWPSCNRKIAQSLETIRNNAKRLERDFSIVREFFQKQ